MLEYQKLIIALLGLVILFQACESSFSPRKIKFAGCSEDVTAPKAVFMSCANAKGSCEVRKGNTHSLRAFFFPTLNSSNILSYAAWNNGWFPIPLPNQKPDACGMMSSCPMVPSELHSFTYQLTIESFWPADEYPVIWTLTDGDTDEEILCFKFRIRIP